MWKTILRQRQDFLCKIYERFRELKNITFGNQKVRELEKTTESLNDFYNDQGNEIIVKNLKCNEKLIMWKLTLH